MATSVSERPFPAGSGPDSSPRHGAAQLDDQYDRLIEQQLTKTRRQLKRVDLAYSLLILAAGVLLYFLNLALIDHWIMPLSTLGRVVALLLLVFGAGSYVVAIVLPLLLRSINPVYAARAIERSQPTLKNSLINFLFLRGERAGMRQSIYDALRQRAAVDLSHVEIETAVDSRHVIRMGIVLAVVFAAAAIYLVQSPKDPLQTAARVLAPWANLSQPTRVQIQDVLPGNQDVFHGQMVVISARLQGVDDSSQVRVIFSTANQQVVNREAAMHLASDGLRWQVTLPVDQAGQPDSAGLQQSLRYRVAAGDAASPEFELNVLPAPTILVKRVEYSFPAYTGLTAVTDQDFGDIRALEGTRVTIHAEANHPIGQAFIEFDPQLSNDSPAANANANANASAGPGADTANSKRPRQRVTLPLKSDGQRATGSFVLRLASDRQTPDHSTYQVRFRTADGHVDQHPVVHDIQVVADLPPEVAILTPVASPTEVAEDGSQRIEIRAVDPDFGLSRIHLRAVTGGTQLLDTPLFDDSAGQVGQTVVNFQFQPRQLGLAAGDRVMFWAVAEDNRTSPGSGQAEPNSQRTRNMQLIILPPKDPDAPMPDGTQPPPEQGEPSAEGDQEGEKSGSGPKGSGGQGAEGQEGGEEGAQQGKQQGQNGQSGQPGQNPSEGGQAGPGQPGKGGRPPQDPASQSEDQTGQSETGQSETGQSGSGAPGQNAPPSGKPPENRDPADPSPPNQSESGGQGAKGAEGQKSGGTRAGQPGDAPGAGEGQTAGEKPPGSDPSDDSGVKPNSSDQPAAGERQSGSKGGGKGGDESGSESQTEPSGPQEPLHDGEVIEKINQLLRQKDPARSEAASKPQSDAAQPPGDQPSNQPSPNQVPGKDLDAGQPSAEDKPQPGSDHGESASPPKGSPDGSGGQPQGDRKAPDDRTPDDREASKPEDAQQPRQGGLGDNGESGSGADSPDKSGSAESQGENRDRPKSQDTPAPPDSKAEEGQSPSVSKRQSDSQGDSSGDRSGGGSKGPGQSANQKGNDSAGSNSPADSGASAAPQTGQGETSDRAGDQKTADQKTGKSGDQAGAGSQSRPNEAGDQSRPEPGDSAGGEGASQDPPSQADPQGSRQPGKGTPTGPIQGGGVAGDGQAPPSDDSAVVPDGEQANLDYARKATDLALEYLESQQDNPDSQLLDKLGWTPEEVRQFVQRWKSLKQNARDGQPGPKGELDDALRSLGLRSQRPQVRQAASQGDDVRGLRESGGRTAPPSRYRELFESYQKATSRRSGS